MKDNNNTVYINLDKPRELRLTHRVMKSFAAKKKISVDEIDQAMSGYSGMVDLIYEMLLRDDPDLTPEHFEELLDGVTIREIMDAGREAVAASLGPAEEKNAENPPAPAG